MLCFLKRAKKGRKKSICTSVTASNPLDVSPWSKELPKSVLEKDVPIPPPTFVHSLFKLSAQITFSLLFLQQLGWIVLLVPQMLPSSHQNQTCSPILQIPGPRCSLHLPFYFLFSKRKHLVSEFLTLHLEILILDLNSFPPVVKGDSTWRSLDVHKQITSFVSTARISWSKSWSTGWAAQLQQLKALALYLLSVGTCTALGVCQHTCLKYPAGEVSGIICLSMVQGII